MKTVISVQAAGTSRRTNRANGRGSRGALVLATGLLLSGWCTAAETRSVVIYPASQDRPEPGNGFVEVGYSRDTVLFVLGDPSSKLNENLWVYRGFRCDLREATRFDTLVLQFEQQKVVAFKFVNEKTLKASVVYFNRQRPGG